MAKNAVIRPRTRQSGTQGFAETGSMRAQVVDRIGREIVSGAYAPESRLPNEGSMLQRYSVSRTALREAYSKLAAKGLIAARPKVGTSVRPQSAWNMLDPEVLGWHLQTMPADALASDLYTLRRMLEPPASALAAMSHDAESLGLIKKAYADMRACAGSEGELIEADLRFHIAILSATNNPFIGAFSALIHAAMVSMFSISWRGAVGMRAERLQQHGDVVDAIEMRDAELARSRMETLLDDSMNDVREVIGNDDVSPAGKGLRGPGPEKGPKPERAGSRG